MKYVEEPDNGLVGSTGGDVGDVGEESDKLNLDVAGETAVVVKLLTGNVNVGGGVLLGVLFLLLKGELRGLGLDVISTRNSPCT